MTIYNKDLWAKSSGKTPTETATNLHIGQLGEEFATNFLISQNLQILQRNFHCRYGEIDIIAFDSILRKFIFVEVKTRTGDLFGEPQEAVNHSKKKKLLKSIHSFFETWKAAKNTNAHTYPKTSILMISPNFIPTSSWRIDIIAVKLDKTLRLKEINHLKNILDG